MAADESAVLSCRADSGEAPVISRQIAYTDFPLDHVSIWVGFDCQWALKIKTGHSWAL